MIIISLLLLIIIFSISYNFNNSFLSSIQITRVTAIIFLYSGVLSLNALYIQLIGSGIGIYSGFFQITIISQFIEIFIYFLSGLILISWPNLYWPINFKHLEINLTKNNKLILTDINSDNFILPKYSFLILFSSLGAGFLISSFDLISIYISIELQSFALYILATIYKDLKSSTSADFHFRKMNYWLQLSNSGNTLKLLIPNYIRKAISG